MFLDKQGEKPTVIEEQLFNNVLAKGRDSMHDVSVGPVASTIKFPNGY